MGIYKCLFVLWLGVGKDSSEKQNLLNIMMFITALTAQYFIALNVTTLENLENS